MTGVDARRRRIARNEATFRDINERLADGLRRISHTPELLEFVCECGDRGCDRLVRMTLEEYEAVRADSRRFAVVPGHVFPDTERVVAGNDRFEVAEKVGPAVDLADAADRRTGDSRGRRSEPPR